MRRLGFIAPAAYFALSVAMFGIRVVSNPAYYHVGFGADPSVMMWCMVWWPHALAHGLDPFVTDAIWYPTGFNLTWATSIPAVALAMLPLTVELGPVVSYNAAALAAPALSAWAMFALCRKVTGRPGPSFIAGLIYGFSPYELGHVLGGHLSLSINFGPPLALLLFLDLLNGRLGRRRFVALFAMVLVVQCLISDAILATMTVLGFAAAVCSMLLIPEIRNRLEAAIAPVAAAYAIAAAALAPFLYMALGRGDIPGETLFPASFFSADLLNLMVPSPLQLLTPTSAAGLASRFSGNLLENQFYPGLPLVAIAVIYLAVRRREPSARLLTVMLAVITAASLGPVLHFGGRALGRTPWAIAYEIPVLRNALPVRFGNYAFLIMALIAGMYLCDVRFPFRRAFAAYAIAALLPNPLLLAWKSHYDNPDFFAKGMYRQAIRPGENVMVYPFGGNGPAMLWQAETWMHFKSSGGYIGPTPDPFRRWPVVNASLFHLPLDNARLQLDAFAQAHAVDAIVVAEGDAEAIAMIDALGIPAARIGGVLIYRPDRSRMKSAPLPDLDDLEEASALRWVDTLLQAAGRFVAAGNSIETLSPAALYEAGMLPASKWASDLEMVLAGNSHGAITGLWIGPGGECSVAVGLFASPRVAASLASRFQGATARIAYPYPRPSSTPNMKSDRYGFLLITLCRGYFEGEILAKGLNSAAAVSAFPFCADRSATGHISRR